ncbi:MAG: ribosome maturation factor RimM [Myxococcaceae bacterium]|nr:ribosome maturation factor RimM [Myxococcaceae bacterium]MCI0670703.1 ribosome maturation factor RimM [Myxococcaceae bacterium]
MSRRAYLEVGFVARAHGLKGEVGVRTFDPASDTLLEVKRVLVRPRSGPERVLVLESVRPTPKELLVLFEGFARREESEALVGAAVLAFREDLEAPAEGQFFQGDLVGLTARSEQGEELGRVEELWSSGEVPNLVIRGGPRGELLVPFADEFVPEVDLERGLVVVRPPEYAE